MERNESQQWRKSKWKLFKCNFCKKSRKQNGKNNNKQTKNTERKEVTKKIEIKILICGRRITYYDSCWDTSFLSTRGNRSWYCHHLQMNDQEAGQNLQEIDPKLILPLYSYCHHPYHKCKYSNLCRIFNTWCVFL